MTPHADLTEILETAAANNLTPSQTAELIISEGWVTIHQPVAAQTVNWAAQQVAEVMDAGERAEAANPEPHQSSLQYAIRHKQLLQNRPDEWLQQLATGLGAATWDL